MFSLLVDIKNRAIAVATVGVTAVTVANYISFASVTTGDGENEVGVVEL